MDASLLQYSKPTTLLEAVNLCLAAAGELPTSTLNESDRSADTEAAFYAVQEASRDVQTEGWWFNTEHEFPCLPGPTGEILLPENCLSIDPEDPYEHLVVRGKKLYDPKKHTFKIARTVHVQLVILLPFEDLPQSARTFVARKAALKFTDNQLASTEAHRLNAGDVEEAQAKLEREENANADHNMLDNAYVSRMRNRG